MRDCDMCGRSTLNMGEYRWFQYNNGERVRAFCCVGCVIQHDLLTDANGDHVRQAGA